MEGLPDSATIALHPMAGNLSRAGLPDACGDTAVPAAAAAAAVAGAPTRGDFGVDEVTGPASAFCCPAEGRGENAGAAPSVLWKGSSPQQQHQQLHQLQQHSAQQQMLRRPIDAGGSTTSTTNHGGGASLSAPATSSQPAQSASPATGDGLRALEEEVRGLDADWDELQKLHDMTEEAAYSLMQSGGGSPHAAHAGSPNAASTAAVGSVSQGGNPGGGVYPDVEEVDRRSVYVGNVDYSSTPAELQEHFKACGTINRITIMVDKFTGHPKGYAYIEFNSEAAVQNAILLSDTVFKHRQIKVVIKRKNIPGFTRARGSWRGGRLAMAGGGGIPRGPRGCRGGFRPMYRPRGGYMRGYGRPY